MQTIGQLVGVIALALAVISFQQKTRKYILTFQLLANIAFVLHFSLIGAYTGALLNAVAMLRSIVFVNKEKRWADKRQWLYVFCVLSIFAGVVTWEAWYSVLPIAGMICSSVAFWVKKPKNVRLISFPSSPLWLIYNLLGKSYAGVLTEIINMTSIIIAIIRLDLKNE